MDFHGNNVHHIGYGHPRLKKAISDEMDRLPFSIRVAMPTIPRSHWQKSWRKSRPGNISKMLFTTGGSDAIRGGGKNRPHSHQTAQDALLLGCFSWRRNRRLRAFWRDAVPRRGLPHRWWQAPSMSRLSPAIAAPMAIKPMRTGIRRSRSAAWPAPTWWIMFLSRESDVACLVAEPARAVPYLPPPGFWKSVREACDRHGTLLIFDEIPTGLGKTGKMFACEHDGVVPDILVMGKSLGGGILPIATVMTRPDLDVGGEWAFGHYTHEKNPVTARAALTTIEIIEDEHLVENAARMGAIALERLEAMKRKHAVIGDVRGRGLLIGIDLVQDRDSHARANDLAEAVMYRALDAGLSFKTTMGNVLTLTPPLTVTEAQMLQALDILDEAIGALS